MVWCGQKPCPSPCMTYLDFVLNGQGISAVALQFGAVKRRVYPRQRRVHPVLCLLHLVKKLQQNSASKRHLIISLHFLYPLKKLQQHSASEIHYPSTFSTLQKNCNNTAPVRVIVLQFLYWNNTAPVSVIVPPLSLPVEKTAVRLLQ